MNLGPVDFTPARGRLAFPSHEHGPDRQGSPDRRRDRMAAHVTLGGQGSAVADGIADGRIESGIGEGSPELDGSQGRHQE